MKSKIYKFTKRNRAVNKKIGMQLDLVCKQILKDIPDAKSIILTGGFARGEGPVKVKAGRIYPFNDYDITVIADTPMSKEDTDRVAVSAARKLGFRGIEFFYDFKKAEQRLEENFYVDLKVLTAKKLRKLMPRIRNYELRNQGLVLYGGDLRNLIPDYTIRDIPLSEPAKLLLDRMSQMVEYFSIRGEYDEEVLTYFIQQAYAACCTALLFLSGKYRHGYKDSMNVLLKTFNKDFPGLAKKLPSLHLRIKRYIDWKLRPDNPPQRDIKGAWFACRRDILEVSKLFFSRFLSKNIETTEELSNAIANMAWKFHEPYIKNMFNGLGRPLHPLATMYLKYKYYKQVRDRAGSYPRIFLSKSPDVSIFAAAPLVMMSLDAGYGIDKEMFEKALRMLRRVYPVRQVDNWEDLTLEYANAYIAFFLQQI